MNPVHSRQKTTITPPGNALKRHPKQQGPKIELKTETVAKNVDLAASHEKVDLKEKKWTVLGLVTSAVTSAVISALRSIQELVFRFLFFITGRGNGRQVLLDEMQRYPKQLLQDVHRRGTFHIGDVAYELSGEINPQDVLKKTKRDLVAYIHAKNPSLHIDDRVVDELLYASVQNFAAPGIIRSVGMYDAAVWCGVGNESERATSYSMEEGNAPVLLHIRQYTNKTLVEPAKKDDPDAPKKVSSIITDIQYNLKTKEVLFHYICTLDKERIEWTTSNPFLT